MDREFRRHCPCRGVCGCRGNNRWKSLAVFLLLNNGRNIDFVFGCVIGNALLEFVNASARDRIDITRRGARARPMPGQDEESRPAVLSADAQPVSATTERAIAKA